MASENKRTKLSPDARSRFREHAPISQATGNSGSRSSHWASRALLAAAGENGPTGAPWWPVNARPGTRVRAIPSSSSFSVAAQALRKSPPGPPAACRGRRVDRCRAGPHRRGGRARLHAVQGGDRHLSAARSRDEARPVTSPSSSRPRLSRRGLRSGQPTWSTGPRMIDEIAGR